MKNTNLFSSPTISWIDGLIRVSRITALLAFLFSTFVQWPSCMAEEAKGSEGVEISLVTGKENPTTHGAYEILFETLPLQRNDWQASMAFIDAGLTNLASEASIANCGATGKVVFIAAYGVASDIDINFGLVLLDMKDGTQTSYSIILREDVLRQSKEGQAVLNSGGFEVNAPGEVVHLDCSDHADKVLVAFTASSGLWKEATLYLLCDLRTLTANNMGMYSTSRKIWVRGATASSDFKSIIAPRDMAAAAKNAGFSRFVSIEDLQDRAYKLQGHAAMVKAFWRGESVWAVITKPKLTRDSDGRISAEHSMIVDGGQSGLSFRPFLGQEDHGLSAPASERIPTISLVTLDAPVVTGQSSRCEVSYGRYIESRMVSNELVLTLVPWGRQKSRESFWVTASAKQTKGECSRREFEPKSTESGLAEALVTMANKEKVRVELTRRSGISMDLVRISLRNQAEDSWKKLFDYELIERKRGGEQSQNPAGLLQIVKSSDQDATFIIYKSFEGYYLFHVSN